MSSDGGSEPVWAHTGKELFYRDGRNKTMVVDVVTHPTFRAERPRVLFEGNFVSGGLQPQYSVTPDGQRFLMIQREPPPVVSRLELVLNWREELIRRTGATR